MVAEIASKQTLTDMIPCGIATVTDDHRLAYVNRYLCELLGYTKEELEKQPVEKIFTVSARIFYQTHFYPLVKLHNKADEVFFSLKAKDDNHVPVIANAQRAGADIYCVFVPVNQRRKYEEEILQAKRTAEEATKNNEQLIHLKNQAELQLAESDRQLTLLKQFNAEYIELNKIISHDLHEPIRKLLVHIDLLRSAESPGKEQLDVFLSRMMDYSDRLRTLTICLQEYVSIDAEKEPLSNIDTGELAQQCFKAIADETGYADATLTMEKLPVMEGYHSQVKRLFLELLGNCFKFRNTVEPLRVNIKSIGFSDNIYKEIKDKYRYIDFVRIEIEDNGFGFSEDYNEYIFGMFKKIRINTGGPGFGLALCKKIVERHKGSISARSSNGTTTISVVLPLKQADLL